MFQRGVLLVVVSHQRPRRKAL